jgi:hypothetical protein
MNNYSFALVLIQGEEPIHCWLVMRQQYSPIPYLAWEADAPPSTHLNSLITAEDMLHILRAAKRGLSTDPTEAPHDLH